MLEFLRKFFLYFPVEGGSPSQFFDGLGEGSYGIRHFLWMGAVIVLSVGLFQLFKRFPKAGKTWIRVFAFLLFFTRLIHQTIRGAIGVENPWTQAFPFHMCTVLTFLMPIVCFFDIKPLKTPVYVLSIMGGIITILLGDYFGDLFLPFSAVEGISAHTLLVLIPIVEIAIGGFELKLSDSWKVLIAILVLMGWATLANEVFYAGLDPNYMYLRHNALPFGSDQNFFFFYILIFLFFFSVIYGSPLLYRRLTRGKKAKSPAGM